MAEKLDELSTDTLTSYKQKASKELSDKGYGKRLPPKGASKQSMNRYGGVTTASQKLLGSGGAKVNADHNWNQSLAAKKKSWGEEVEMYTIEDLVAAAVAQKPGDFEEAFSHLMLEKIGVVVDEKKLEIAQNMFNPVAEEDE